jgi:hypothetical protein
MEGINYLQNKRKNDINDGIKKTVYKQLLISELISR